MRETSVVPRASECASQRAQRSAARRLCAPALRIPPSCPCRWPACTCRSPAPQPREKEEHATRPRTAGQRRAGCSGRAHQVHAAHGHQRAGDCHRGDHVVAAWAWWARRERSARATGARVFDPRRTSGVAHAAPRSCAVTTRQPHGGVDARRAAASAAAQARRGSRCMGARRGSRCKGASANAVEARACPSGAHASSPSGSGTTAASP